jgi:hypothetical protein
MTSNDRKSFSVSTYFGCEIVLTTKHSKSIAIAPPFRDRLGARILEHALDTDQLGTFSGEVERKGTAFECARRKCEWSLDENGCDYGLASEGSFGPHPSVAFLSCDLEILYFIDRKRDFHLSLSHLSARTNYRMQALDSMDTLREFAEKTKFPAHALIVRPNHSAHPNLIFKGINSIESLEDAFQQSLKRSTDGKVWVETDMRAHMNPSRMAVIGEIADKLARQLAANCPSCQSPGWGVVRVAKGLECGWCGQPTEWVKEEIFGCVKCRFEETASRSDGLKKAEPRHCSKCNS